jgi:hypothetical protein
MRKLGRNKDSLELLLDTVCSMFGAILLIAILVALMAQTARVDPSGERASAEILQRRIATAEADLAQSQRLANQIGVPPATTAGALAREKEQLAIALAAARAEQQRVQEQLQSQISRQTADHSDEWKKLLADEREFMRQQVELENDIKTQDQNAARLIARSEALAKSTVEEKQAHIVTLRFPKEHARTKRTLPVICRYGKIYPLMSADGTKNETTVVWSKKGSNELARPVEALGWSPTENKSALEELFGSVSKEDQYLAFYVYPDSFDAFHTVRDMATAAHLEFGMELDRAGSDLLWGEDGASPPPL